MKKDHSTLKAVLIGLGALLYGASPIDLIPEILAGRPRDAEAKVPLEWLESSNLVGPASYVRERIEAYRAAGVTDLQVTVAGGDPVATIGKLKEWAA